MRNPTPSLLNTRVVLIGPGGVGKTTLGGQLASEMHRPFLDLDDLFCERVDNIRQFIGSEGYAAYARQNGDLMTDLLRTAPEHAVLALSSGALSEDMPAVCRSAALANLRAEGRTVLVMPCWNDEEAAAIVADRQVRRGFGLTYEPERSKYLRRIAEYRRLGFPELHWSDRNSATILEQLAHSLPATTSARSNERSISTSTALRQTPPAW